MIRAIKLGKLYQEGSRPFWALKDISLEIKAGEFVAIVGPSGSGKSTLLHLLGGLDRPSRGRIFWYGQELNTLSDRQLAHFRVQTIGFVFQQFFLLPRLTAKENILLPTLYNPQKPTNLQQRLRILAQKLGIARRLDHFPNQLSGGEQQRVAIARALINQPKAILADEPTGNLDSKTGNEIIHLLRQLNREEKVTLIIVTHNEAIAKQADRIIQIKDGRLQTSN